MIISFVSEKGGVGKTTLTSNLAIAFRELGKRVLVVDGDFRTASLTLSFGITKPPFTILDLLERADLKDVIISHPSGIEILASPISSNLSYLELTGLNFPSYFDIILIDTQPSIKASLPFIKLSDKAIIVSTQDIPSLFSARKVFEKLKKMGIETGIIVNRYRKIIKKEVIERFLDLPILGFIPEDDRVLKSFYRGFPAFYLFPKCRFSKEVRKVAYRILGLNFKESIFDKLFRWLK